MTTEVLAYNAVPVTHAWVVDASPFIGLAKVGLLDLLTGPGREILVTDTVRQEVMSGSAYDVAQRALDQGWGVSIAAPPLPPELATLRLDAGEASVLAVALSRPGSVAVIDDRPGRVAAHLLGVPVVGTAGVLVRAKQEGRLVAVAPELRRLDAAGIFLPGEALLTALLANVEETWP